MKTALSVLLDAIEQERKGISYIDFFSFRYQNVEFSYLGRYYAFVHIDNRSGSDEYEGSNYDELIDCVIAPTGKTVRQILSELTELDLEIMTDTYGTPSSAR